MSSPAVALPIVFAVEWRPLLPVQGILLGVAVVLTLAVSAYVREARGLRSAGPGAAKRLLLLLGLRLAAILALAVILLNPTRVESQPGAGFLRPFFILLDTSESMCVEDLPPLAIDDEADRDTSGDPAPLNRLAHVQRVWLAPDFVARLSEVVEPHWFTFGERRLAAAPAEAATAAPVGQSTHLAEALAETLGDAAAWSVTAHAEGGGDARAEGILLLTDGHDTTDESLAALLPLARQAQVPIHAAPVGTTQRQPDLAVRLRADHAFVYRNQKTTLRGEIDQVGFDGRAAEVILEADGVEIERRTVTLAPQPVPLTFDVTPAAPQRGASIGEPEGEAGDDLVGLCAYRVRVEPLPGERLTTNNERHAFVQITRKSIRVLLFENEPYWDTKFLVQALRNDAQVELTTVIGLGRREQISRYAASGAPMDGGDAPENDIPSSPPTTDEELAKYDIVILGRGCERWFPDDKASALVRFVDECGGSLVLARGIPFDALEPGGAAALDVIDPLSPVRWAQGTLVGGRLRRDDGAARGQPGDPLEFREVGETETILTELPGMLARTRIEGEKAASIVWVRTDPTADNTEEVSPRYGSDRALPVAMAHQQYGHGRILAILVDGLWQWAMLPPTQGQYDPVFDLFWTRAVRWFAGGGDLLPGQSIGLSLNRLTLAPGETVEITVQTRYIEPDSFAPTLTVIAPDGVRETLDPARAGDRSTAFTASYRASAEGVHTVELDCPGFEPDRLTSRFAVYAESRELLDPSVDAAALEALAAATGGCVIPADRPEKLLEVLQAERAARQSDPIERSAWLRHWLLFAILVMLGAEWLTRRWWGMP